MKGLHLTVLITIISCMFLFSYSVHGINDKAVFIEVEDEFNNQLKEKAKEAVDEEGTETVMKMDFSGVDIPKSAQEFRQVWHFPPVTQDLTGSCWSFASTSFFESEIYRLTGRKIKLSEMYSVYWEYVEKARRYVRERGDSVFGRGSEANATPRIWRQYGIVPFKDYRGKNSEDDIYDDRAMYAEMKSYLESIKEQNAWNEEQVIETIKSILNHHMGVPPDSITVNGKTTTPQDYLKNHVQLNMDDYVDLLSLMKEGFYKKVEYKVPDNWWHSNEYYNVPVDDFVGVIKKAVRDGYTVCMLGDNSEPGFYDELDVAMIPSFDIPSEYITDEARQFRFSNESTTDDHAIHLVGYLEKDGKDWYLIKDSGTKAQNGQNKGYMLYHKNFVRLKMMNIMVHKDAVKDILERFQ